MSEILLLIAGTVVAINLVYVLLPNGSFEKYSRYTFGLILILVFIGTLTNAEISSQVLDFDSQMPVYNNDGIKETINNQTEKLIESKIKEQLTENNIVIDNLYVFLEENELEKVVVIPKNKNESEKICDIISSFCDIQKEIIIIE
ncbi:MAG: stage III sporulation protein AF [Clostridia bacterium]|nr:stage III sporulation protein AF [Clostridia bacterium]